MFGMDQGAGSAAGEDGVSQGNLAVSSKLTSQAISKILGRLTRAGLVTDAGRAPSTGGKPATLLRLTSAS